MTRILCNDSQVDERGRPIEPRPSRRVPESEKPIEHEPCGSCDTCKFEDFWTRNPNSGIPSLRIKDKNERRCCTAECSDKRDYVTETHELTDKGWKVTTERHLSIDGLVDIHPGTYNFIKKNGCRIYQPRGAPVYSGESLGGQSFVYAARDGS